MNKVLDVFSDACKIISCLKFLNLSSCNKFKWVTCAFISFSCTFVYSWSKCTVLIIVMQMSYIHLPEEIICSSFTIQAHKYNALYNKYKKDLRKPKSWKIISTRSKHEYKSVSCYEATYLWFKTSKISRWIPFSGPMCVVISLPAVRHNFWPKFFLGSN